MDAKRRAYIHGFAVLIALVILTVAEILLSKTAGALMAIFVIDLFQAGIIANYFMHIARLWSEEAH